MEMTNGDIVLSFKRSGRKKTQIGILADLNGCSKQDIEKILIEAGENVKEGRKKMATQQQEVPDAVTSLLIKRIEELDEIISSAEKEYREIAKFLEMGGKR